MNAQGTYSSTVQVPGSVAMSLNSSKMVVKENSELDLKTSDNNPDEHLTPALGGQNLRVSAVYVLDHSGRSNSPAMIHTLSLDLWL